MCIKFESRKICVAGNECDNSDFDFCNAEKKVLPVIKISSCEEREDCQQLKPKGTQGLIILANLSFLLIFVEDAGQQCVTMSLCALIYSEIRRITSVDDMIQTVTVGSQILLVYSSLSLLARQSMLMLTEMVSD